MALFDTSSNWGNGSFDFSDIYDGLKAGANAVGGMFDSPTQRIQGGSTSVTQNPSIFGMDMSSATTKPVQNSSGIFGNINLETLGKFASGAKDATDIYTSLVTMPEYYKQQNALQQGILDLNRQNIANTEAERQRQIAKEAEANQAMSSGFNASGLGLYDEKKKQQVLTDTGRNIENSNYYAV